MTSGAPWSVKGIDPKAREIAKDLARRSGMTLGEWLNQMIMDDEPAPEPAPPPPPSIARRRFDTAAERPAAPIQRLEAPAAEEDDIARVAEALDRLSARIEAAEHRSTLAISGIDQSVVGVLTRIEGAERTQNQVAARFEGALDDVRADQQTLTHRLAELERERTGARSAEALKSLEGALTRVAGHLYEGEGRTRDSLGAMKQEIDGLAEKVRRIDSSNDPGGAAALIDSVVGRIGERLEQAEARTSAALKGLEGSFASLDQRLRTAEDRIQGQGPAERRFEQIAAELSQRVDQVRSELAERLKGSVDQRYDRMEGALREMTSHVQAAEQRSAQAIERMGQEVVRMTDQLNQKVSVVEHRSADAIGKVSGDMARIADAMEGRLKRADATQAEALEKLGAEIARITERLAERIANAERRSAQSMDDVGEQVSRVTERLQQRQERASSELVERMRQSEERTAKLLDEAREKIDQRLSETSKRLADAPAAQMPPPAPPMASYGDPFSSPYSAPQGGPVPFGAHDFDQSAFGPAAYNDPGLAPPPIPPAAAHAVRSPPYDEPSYPEPGPPETAHAPPAPVAAFGDFHSGSPFDETSTSAAPAFAESDFEAAEDYQPGSSAEREPLGYPGEDVGATRSASTRELIAQARAAAKAASEATEKKGRKGGGGAAKAAGEAGSLFSGFGIGRKKKPENSAVKTALLMSAAAACLGIGASGYVLINGGSIAGWSEDGSGAVRGDENMKIAMGEEGTPAAGAEPLDPRLALAMAPDPAAAPAPPSPEAQTLYAQAVAAIDAGDASGLEPLRRAANLGYAPAQFFLAKLYVDGGAGLKKDLQEARRWSARAAANGEPHAMHQLGTFYVNGDGGEKNAVAGYEWFKKAAALGFVDSQYNLGMMSEAGMGVPSNPAEAYKWYLIAGRAGDEEARSRAQKLKAKLSAAERAVAERAVASFRPETLNPSAAPPSAVAAAPAAGGTVALAQKALSRMGYYQGPTDGTASAALRLAIAAYQRDQGLPANGALTPDLVQRFAASGG